MPLTLLVLWSSVLSLWLLFEPLVERTQWRRVVFGMPNVLAVTNVADSTYGYAIEVDTVAGRMELWRRRDPATRYTLRYTRPAPGVVRMEGTLQGDTVSIRLQRMDETKVMAWRKPMHLVTDPALQRR